MKRLALIIAVLSITYVFANQVLADDGYYDNNIVQVNHPYYGGHHGGYNGGYRGGYNAYRVYRPPVIEYVVPYYADVPAMFAPPRMNPYYYQPRGGFYYNSPRFSVGVGY
jgi:hypothetical protein